MQSSVNLKLNEEVRSNSLSKREIEVIFLIKEGLCNSEIAEKLDLSIKTVENHVRSILKKLDAKNRTDAVVIAIKSQIIDI